LRAELTFPDFAALNPGYGACRGGKRPALRIFSVRGTRDQRRRSLREKNARRLTARIIETNSRATNHLTSAARLHYRA
jgi:hypothetical protein